MAVGGHNNNNIRSKDNEERRPTGWRIKSEIGGDGRQNASSYSWNVWIATAAADGHPCCRAPSTRRDRPSTTGRRRKPVVWVLRRNEIERIPIPCTGRHATAAACALARPSSWSHPERGGQLPVSAHAARARTLAHTDVNPLACTHVYTHTRPRSLDYSIVDSARAHSDGRQFAVCACSVTVFAVTAAADLAVRKRTAVPHPSNHCSLSGSILLFVVICRERARQFGVYNNPSPVVSL